MEAALIGLVGVIVGGLITAGSQLWVARRERKRSTQRARRLICGELLNASLILRTISKLRGDTWPQWLDPAMLPTSAFQEYGSELAAEVSEKLWNQVVGAYSVLSLERARFKNPTQEVLTDESVIGLRKIVIQLSDLRKALGDKEGWFEDSFPYLPTGVPPRSRPVTHPE